MSALPISQLESSFLEILEPFHARRGGPVKTLRGAPGPLRAPRVEIAAPSPALLLRHAGSRECSAGSGQLGGWSKWILTVAIAGGRDEPGRRRGGPGDSTSGAAPNAWGLLHALRGALSGCSILRGCGPLRWRSEEPVEANGGWAVWEQTWEFSLPGYGLSPPVMALASGAAAAAISGEVIAAQDEFSLESEPESFIAGLPVFIQSGNGTQNRYLGHILAAADGVIQTERAPGISYAEGARLWIPSSWFEWSAGRYPLIGSGWNGGVDFQRTLDGAGVSARLRAEARSAVFGIGPVPSEEISRFHVWLNESLRSGLDPFTFADERGETARAWIQAGSWRENLAPENAASLSFDLALDACGTAA